MPAMTSAKAASTRGFICRCLSTRYSPAPAATAPSSTGARLPATAALRSTVAMNCSTSPKSARWAATGTTTTAPGSSLPRPLTRGQTLKATWLSWLKGLTPKRDPGACLEGGDLVGGEFAPFAFGQVAEAQGADGLPVQGDHVVADGGEHPLHLVILAFKEGEFGDVRFAHGELRRAGGALLAVEQHPLGEGLDNARQGLPRQRLIQSDPVDLAAAVLRRGDPVGPLAVVGEQHQAGGVHVQAPHRLQALHLGQIDQVDGPRIEGAPGGALHPGGLVQHQVAQPHQGQGLVVPGDAVRLADLGRWVLDHFPVDPDFAAVQRLLGQAAGEFGGLGEKTVQAHQKPTPSERVKWSASRQAGNFSRKALSSSRERVPVFTKTLPSGSSISASPLASISMESPA